MSGAAPELQQRVAAAERRLSEAQEELTEAKAERDTKVGELQRALEEERKKATRATEQLKEVHVEAGIHEAQEMVQLKLGLAALTEEVEFLRERETEVEREGNRLRNVQEMSRRLGANISKSELENLRAHVKSLQEG